MVIALEVSKQFLLLLKSPKQRMKFTVSNVEVDEFQPTFKTQPLTVTINEVGIEILKNNSLQVGKVIILLNNTLTDQDCPPHLERNVIRITNYTIDPQVNGAGIMEVRLGSVGDVVLTKPIDFDIEYTKRQPVYYMVNVIVTDQMYRVTTTTLRINVKDVNDLPPAFDTFTYKSHTSVKYRGQLTVTPSAIHAIDQDLSINCSIVYSIVPSGLFSQCFDIDSSTGEISQILDVTSPAEVIQIQAKENCPNTAVQLQSTVPLLITLNNHTVNLPPNAGKSTADEGSDFRLILIVIGVVALVIIIALLVGFVFYHKRMSRAVRPEQDRPETPHTEEEDLDTDRSGSKEVLIDPMMLPTPAGKKGQLPPLNMTSTGTGMDRKKKRSRRRKKVKEPDIYDGTVQYDMAADPEFFNSTQKDKIKRSTRSKDNKTTDPNRRINVQNE
ncbi:protocadherin Fat 3-like [Ylistrum balloti]|uniref:protocadherin Fat 3-like n=1 Tax=Ylistrum balloti TaxID=509963 RepID=UPI002905B003|nr:protocadherin Fat 3-like [Ylistrum balloti]